MLLGGCDACDDDDVGATECMCMSIACGDVIGFGCYMMLCDADRYVLCYRDVVCRMVRCCGAMFRCVYVCGCGCD